MKVCLKFIAVVQFGGVLPIRHLHYANYGRICSYTIYTRDVKGIHIGYKKKSMDELNSTTKTTTGNTWIRGLTCSNEIKSFHDQGYLEI